MRRTEGNAGIEARPNRSWMERFGDRPVLELGLSRPSPASSVVILLRALSRILPHLKSLLRVLRSLLLAWGHVFDDVEYEKHKVTAVDSDG